MREARDRAAAEAAAAEPTEYARSRPRRETAAVGATTFRDAGGGTLELHPMRKFSPSPPGSGVPGAQPFKLTVSPAAMLVMDLHAHLCTNEVIGYLGGSWDPDTKSLTIERAFPGRGVASGMDVEMDPIAEVELKSQVEAQNMKVVGWYHSHPCSNQRRRVWTSTTSSTISAFSATNPSGWSRSLGSSSDPTTCGCPIR